MNRSWRLLTGVCALLVGLGLLAFTLKRVDLGSGVQLSKLFGPGLALAFLPGAGWHLLRTEAWRRAFPENARIRFATLFRIRLSAEAFSYVTIAGVTGEPLKVVLLAPAVPPPVSAAATALERGAYTVVTAAVVAVAGAMTAWRVPLTPQWARIYTWIAMVAGVIAIVPLALLLARRSPLNPPPTANRSPSASAARTFLRQFAAQFLALVTGDRRRVIAIVALEAGAFLMMALEVFAAFWLTGTPVTLLGSVAVETFTRVASFATVFIPGNVGALEVSNVAAAAAVHAASGGVALALLRRFRGLAWCVAGFLIYPRGWAKCDRDSGRRDPTAHEPNRTLVLIQHQESDALLAESLGGMPVGERIARAALRAGYTRIIVWSPGNREALWRSVASRCSARLDILATNDAARWHGLWQATDPSALFTVVAPGFVPSPPLLAAARNLGVDRDDSALEFATGESRVRSAVLRMAARQLEAPDRIAARFSDPLRAEAPPAVSAPGSATLTLSIGSDEALADAQHQLRASIFKPTDGPLGRLNRRLSIPISVALIRFARLSAHTMSLFVIVLGLSAGWLFSRGDYISGIAAALVSWAASVLDGCDGELARLQYKESAFGCWVDTLGDYTYYVAIFTGMTIGAVRQTGWPAVWWCGAALGIGVMLTFVLLILLRWRTTEGQPERLRSRTMDHFERMGKRWARVVAQLSTCATRATMPYGILGFAIAGWLPVVVVLATIGAHIYWITLAREFRRLMNDRSGADARLAQLTA